MVRYRIHDRIRYRIQGCGLSPLLFSLYMAGLGERLHAMKEVVNFNG